MKNMKIALAMVSLFALTGASQAAVTKADSGTDLTADASWTTAAPTSSDVATWTGSSLGTGLTLGTSASWLGIDIQGAAGAIDITGAGALTLGASGVNIASGGVDFSISNAIALGSNQSWTIGSGRAMTASGLISGGYLLTKAGVGTLTLSNASNSYSGGTTINAGTLSFANGALGSSGNITMNGGTLQWASTNTQDISSRLNLVNSTTATLDTNGNDVTLATAFGGSTSGVLTKVGTGTLALSGVNTYTGGTTVSNGTLKLSTSGLAYNNSNGNTGGGSINISSGAILQVTKGYNIGYAQAVNINGGTLDMANNVSGDGQNYTLNLSFTGGGSITGAGALRWGELGDATITVNGTTTATISAKLGMIGTNSKKGTINVVDAAGNLNFSGQIYNLSGTCPLFKTGSGTLTLSGANTFTGNTTINGGTLVANLKDTTTNSTNPTATSLGNMTTTGRTITVNSGATLTFKLGDAIGAYNYKTPVAIIADGGTITRTYTDSSNYFNSLGDITLKNGAHLTTAKGGNGTVHSFAINGTITVSGTSGSFIDTSDGTNSNNGLQLLTGGGTTTFDVGSTGVGNNDLTVSVAINDAIAIGAGGLTASSILKTGAGKMVLSGVNTYTGKTSITGGTLSIAADSGLGAAPGSAVADKLTLNGGTLVVSANSQTLNANRGITLGSSGGKIDISALGYNGTLTVSPKITGTGALTLSGAGDTTPIGGGNANTGITLTNTGNDFTGDVTITAGLVAYSNNSVFGNAANKIIFNGGGLIDNNVNVALSRNIEVQAGGGYIRLWNNSNVAWSGAITGSGTISRTDTGTLTLSGDISGFSGSFIQDGAAAIATKLTGTASSIGGNWTATVGTITFNSAVNQTLAGTTSGSLAQTGIGVLTLTGTASTIGGTWAISNGGLAVNSAANQSLAGVISGAGPFAKSGTGTLALSGANTLTGDITVDVNSALNANYTAEGTNSPNSTNPIATALGNMTTNGRTITVKSGATLTFTKKDAIGAYNYKTPVKLIADGGTITRIANDNSFNSIGDIELKNGGRLRTTNGNADTVGSFGLNGNVTVSGTSGSFIDTLSGQNTRSFINLGTTAGSTTFDVGATGDATADLTVSAVLADKTLGGAAALIKTGAGKMVLSAANTYTGTTTVNAGTLAYGANNVISSGAVTVDGATAVLSIGGYSDTVGAVSLKNGGLISGTGGTLTGSSYAVESGSVSAKLGGSSVALTKSTAGTVTLSGSNSYTGATQVTAGVLEVANLASIGNSLVTVDAGATLKNNGTISGQVTATGIEGSRATVKGSGSFSGGLIMSSYSTLAPGNSPGTITTDSLTLDALTVSDFELTPTITTPGGVNNDLVIVTGNLTLNGTLNVASANGDDFLDVARGTTWLLFSYGGILTGSGLTLGTTPDLGSGLSWQVNTDTLEKTVNLTVIPEPGTAGVMMTFLAAALLRKRRFG